MVCGVGAGSVDAQMVESALGYDVTRGGPPLRGVRRIRACGPAYPTDGVPDWVLEPLLLSRPHATSNSAPRTSPRLRTMATATTSRTRVCHPDCRAAPRNPNAGSRS